MPESSPPEGAVVSLLRALSVGLAAYRLFPDDLEQPGFVAAVERVREAAADALVRGPVEVEVEGGTFRSAAGLLPSDERLERLAMACYERQAERLMVRAIPDAAELAAVFRALSVPVAEAVAAGGAAELLDGAGTGAVVLAGVHPEPAEGSRAVEGEAEEPGRGAGDPFSVVEEVAGRGGSAGEQADLLLMRFRTLISRLPRNESEGPDPYVEIHDAMAGLRADVRSALIATLVERSLHDTFAERLVGTMTDSELAASLVAAESEDPVALARRLVAAGRRREDLVELTAAVRDAGGAARVAEVEAGVFGAPGSAPVAEAVTDLVAQRLLAGSDDDLRAIREAAGATMKDGEGAALRALHDYLLIEDNLDVLGRVLDVWTERVRTALREGAAAEVARLMDLMERVGKEVPSEDPAREALIQGRRSRVLDVRFLREMFAGGAHRDNPAFTSLLERLGVVAIDLLLEVLAEEENRRTRLELIGMLVELARGHHTLIARRLEDPRWYVARNAVTILHRVGGREVLPLLQEAAEHPAGPVRKEAIWGIFAVAGVEGVPVIRRLAADPDPLVRDAALAALGSLTGRDAVDALVDVIRNEPEKAVRRGALEQLGQHPAPEALAALEELGARGTRPRLPRDLRRRARVLAKRRRREEG